MTYYEEFGLERDASREEIRHAYKRLVRLLHPDQCTEDATRRLADLQMKRLNAILAVLMDAETRAAYDSSLLAAPAKRPEPGPWWRSPPALGVAGVLAVLIFCAILPLRQPQAKPQAAPAYGPPSVSPPPRPARHTAPRATSRAAPVDQQPQPESLPEYHQPATENRRTETGSLVPPEAPRFADEPAPNPTPTIAGDWLFVASPSIKNTGYPPEYIELRVSDDHGAVRGRYRARYRIGDRAISPNVVFQFEGRAAPGGGVLPGAAQAVRTAKSHSTSSPMETSMWSGRPIRWGRNSV